MRNVTSCQVHGAAQTGIRRVAVIGAGSMGSGIAAQFANAGIPVELIDLPGEAAAARCAAAEAAVARQLKIQVFFMVTEARVGPYPEIPRIT